MSGERQAALAIDIIGRLLTRSHLACLLVYLGSLVLRSGDCAAALGMLALGAVAAELLPRQWHRRALPELLVLIASLISLSQIPHNSAALGLLLRGFIACWILIPSRLGMLRLFPLLLAADLALSPRIDLTFLPLMPLAFSALIVDTWLRTMMQDLPGIICNHHPRISPAPWLLVAVPLLCLVAATAGHEFHAQALRLARQHHADIRMPDQGTAQGGDDLATGMRIGDHRWVNKSPLVMARTIYSDPSAIPPVVYLRALCVPDIDIDDGQIGWSSLPSASQRLGARATWYEVPDDAPQNRVLRMRGSSDVVLRPDGGAWVGLADCIGDDDGNCYQAGIGLANAAYDAHSGDDRYPNISTRLDAYRYLPDDLRATLRQRFPELEQWALLDAQTAAARISAMLRRRCTYSSQDLPEPPPGEASALLQFIDGPEDKRVGHCQYFASAATVLLRAAGFAARPVVGYTSSEIEEDSVIFRAMNAHAWTEVLVDQRIWLRVDATPPDALAVDAETLARWKAEHEETLPPVEDLVPQRQVPWRSILLGLGVTIMLGTILLARRRQPQANVSPRERQLQAQREALLSLASGFGIEVRQSTSMSRLILALEERSGVPLRPTLQRYLDARFAERGEVPAWPMDRLKQALQARRTTRKQAVVTTG